MELNDLRGKKIGIVGFGIEGQAVAAYLERNGLSFSVFDKSRDPEYLSKIGECDVLFRSPGVRFLFPEIQQAIQKGAVVTSQIKYFFENCPAKIIGVTGTKGKGTTSKLIYEILQAAGVPSYLGGNFGIGVLDLLGKLRKDDYVVLELSSFQLQDLHISPYIAVVLMVTAEHLDYHADTNEYVLAKSSITRFQGRRDFAIVNYDYENSKKIGELGEAQKFFVHTVAKGQQPESELQIQNGIFADQAENTIYFVEQGSKRAVSKIDGLLLPGFHNVQNICAAMMVAKILDIDQQLVNQTIKQYRGLEHRLEFVAEINGIKFYNDSIGTTPESAIAAIQSFDQPEILIIGGFDKKADYNKFAKQICEYPQVKAAIAIGDIGSRLVNYLKQHGFKGKIISGAKSMAEIFSQIKTVAKSGDVVLLAPATSSFGMFRDYKQRGEQFKENVLKF